MMLLAALACRDVDTDLPADTEVPVETDVVDTDSPADTDDTSVSDALGVVINSPLEGATYEVGADVPLAAIVTRGGEPTTGAITWTSAALGPIAEGGLATWTAAGDGADVLTATTTFGDETASASVGITVHVPVPTEAEVESFGTEVGLPDPLTTVSMDADAAGNVWIATRTGLVRFDGAAATTWTTADGLGGDAVRSVLAASDGEIWVGYEALTDRQAERLSFAGDALTVDSLVFIDKTHEIKSIYRFFEEPGDGDVWLGTNEGLCLYDRDLDVYLEHRHPTHPHGQSLGVTVTDDGTQWVADAYQVSRWTYLDDGDLYNTGALVGYQVGWPVDVGVRVDNTDASAFGNNVLVTSLIGVLSVDGSSPTGAGVATVVGDGVIGASFAVRYDRRGTAWIGAEDGLYELDTDGTITLVSGPDGDVPGPISALTVDDTTDPPTVWAASLHALYRVRR